MERAAAGPASRATVASRCRNEDGQVEHGTILTAKRKNAHDLAIRHAQVAGLGHHDDRAAA
jgi:hypothetical protein